MELGRDQKLAQDDRYPIKRMKGIRVRDDAANWTTEDRIMIQNSIVRCSFLENLWRVSKWQLKEEEG